MRTQNRSKWTKIWPKFTVLSRVKGASLILIFGLLLESINWYWLVLRALWGFAFLKLLSCIDLHVLGWILAFILILIETYRPNGNKYYFFIRLTMVSCNFVVQNEKLLQNCCLRGRIRCLRGYICCVFVQNRKNWLFIGVK